MLESSLFLPGDDFESRPLKSNRNGLNLVLFIEKADNLPKPDVSISTANPTSASSATCMRMISPETVIKEQESCLMAALLFNLKANYSPRGNPGYSPCKRCYHEFDRGPDTILEHTSCGTCWAVCTARQRMENDEAFDVANALHPPILSLL